MATTQDKVVLILSSTTFVIAAILAWQEGGWLEYISVGTEFLSTLLFWTCKKSIDENDPEIIGGIVTDDTSRVHQAVARQAEDRRIAGKIGRICLSVAIVSLLLVLMRL